MDTRDILFLTLSLAIAVITAMFIWVFVYFLRLARTLTTLVEDFRHRLSTIDDILQTIKEKLTNTHVELTALVGTVRQLVGWFVERRTKKRSSTRSDKES